MINKKVVCLVIMNQKGFAPILIVLLIALVIGGYFVYRNYSQYSTKAPSSTTQPTTYSTPQPSPVVTPGNTLPTIIVSYVSIESRSGYSFELRSDPPHSRALPRIAISQAQEEPEIVDAIRVALSSSRLAVEDLRYYNLFVASINVKGDWAAAGAILVDKVTNKPAASEPLMILLNRINGLWIAEFEGSSRFRQWIESSLSLLFNEDEQKYYQMKYDIR